MIGIRPFLNFIQLSSERFSRKTPISTDPNPDTQIVKIKQASTYTEIPLKVLKEPKTLEDLEELEESKVL